MTREPDHLTSTISLYGRNDGSLQTYWFGFTGQPIGHNNTGIYQGVPVDVPMARILVGMSTWVTSVLVQRETRWAENNQ
ncbi:hypothetical protein A1F99_091870 [Pyrenophora tritici-repentis]|nr:hypothetical protein A1F99_091870 [Pyrenophora tritici-repentis]KAI1561659.1 hypothetical protein PtrEW13061_012187 [Pyrenophora tritici-repentis]